MIINHNIPSLNAYRHLNKNMYDQGKVLEKLSSGLRINRAADDAAGLAISQKMRAQIRGLSQAESNISHGQSLIQTAEGGLQEIHGILQRMRELAVTAANDTYTDFDRSQIQKEIEQLKGSINDIANHTEFNKIKLLNGTVPPSPITGVPVENEADYSRTLGRPPVAANGVFLFKTNEGYPTTDVDNNKNLVYDAGGRSSVFSNPSVRINGTSYSLFNSATLVTPTVEENGDYTTVFTIPSEGVKITQIVRIVGQYQDKYEIIYTMENTTLLPKNIGFQFHADTQLGSDDNAKFIINGAEIPTSTVYTGDAIPNDFTIFNRNTPEFQAHGILKTTGEFEVLEEPSKFGVGNYSELDQWNWSSTSTINDGGYGIWWNERVINPNSTFTVNTFYGQSIPEAIPTPGAPSPDEGPHQLILKVGPNPQDNFLVLLTDARTTTLELDDIDLSTRVGAESAISQINRAIELISSERTKYGAYDNALGHLLHNASNYRLNITAANSRIEDADMALKMTEFTKRNIINQSATAMLAQSNQLPQGILQLLK